MQGTKSPLDGVGAIPNLPPGWDSMPVQQDATRPLQNGHRWPLTFYRQATVQEVNDLLGWSRWAA